MDLTLKYGSTTQSAEIEDRRVIEQVASSAAVPIDDVGAAFEHALARPAGPALEDVISPGDRVLVMTVDHTRPNPSPILWPLMERIEGLGAKPEIMIGLGNHRAMTDKELDEFIGTRDVHQNDSRSPDQWRLGATRHGTPIEVSPVLREFDKRIVVGFIEPHYIAGFSGGRKMILPGCSSRAATTHNHFLTALHGPQLGILDGNPIHEDMLEAALAVGVCWLCDVVVNPDDSFHSIHCGDMIAAHLQGARVAERLYCHTIKEQADIVVCSPGGWPYDIDMVQGKKALAPALTCVKPGGAVILLAECEGGWGAAEPDWDLLSDRTCVAARQEIRQAVRDGRLERDWAACSPGLLFSRVVHDIPARLIVVSRLSDQLEDTYLEQASDLMAALGLAEERLGKQATIISIHEGRRGIARAAEGRRKRGLKA